MSERRSFLEDLRQLDGERQAERLRPGAVHRIARRLDAEILEDELPARRRTWIPMVSFAAGAAMVLAVFTLGGEPQVAIMKEPAPPPMLAAWHVGGDNCHVTRGDAELVLDGSCRVEPPQAGVVIESRATTRLRPTEHGVVLLDGTALFESMSGPEGVPWRVEVPGGVLELLATRLSVVVSGDEGHVDLLEGTMLFMGEDGSTHEVEPGERFRFGASGPLATWTELSPEPAITMGAGVTDVETVELADEANAQDDLPLAAGERLAALGRPDSSSSKVTSRGRGRGGTTSSSEALGRVVEQVASLRAQRQYEAAVELLRDALEQRWDHRTREVLSYELGMILSTQLRDRDQACTHWTVHRDRFPSGRYARAVARAQERLGCD